MGGVPVQAESDEIRMLEVERLGHRPPSRAVTEADLALQVSFRHFAGDVVGLADGQGHDR